MTPKRITNKFLKIIAFISGGILVLLTAFHFWFINHAGELIEELVYSQSNGNLTLKVDKFKFNWFTYKMELRKPVFYSNDTAGSTAYQFRVDKINIRLKAIFPLLFQKKILVDSLHLFNPDIRVIRLRSSTKDTTDPSDTAMSIPQEMGRIYNSIQDALQVLKVNRFQIDNGKFSLINKIRPEEPPVVISNINFHLDNLQVDTTLPAREQKILFSDNVAMHTTNQNILFPDRRHRLSFSNFRINILNRFVEFDSCTVTATRGDSAKNSFSIFFNKLQMTNIDFSLLYHNEIIKADSVYCINPRFRLDVDLEKRTGPAKAPPNLNDLIQQLTGEMQLAFVVVENGSFDINTLREGRPSSFTSDHNNFELQGLAIKKDGPRALTVEKFIMAIRNYENFLHDSAYAIQFDSILINNNRISLSNFTYKELHNNKIINSISMPQFELQGLSWDNLVFDQQLKAEKVTLYHPIINYNVARNKRFKSGDVFQTLSDIGNYMQLDNLSISDGQVNLFFKKNTELSLENANMSVLGKKLVSSHRLIDIQHSVNELFFKKGFFKMGDIIASLNDVNFTGGMSKQLHAGNVQVKNNDNQNIINATDVAIRSMIIDDDIQQTVISGINWKTADIRLSASADQNKKSIAGFTFKKIEGTNTSILATNNNKKISLFLQDLKADELSAVEGSKPKIAGLIAKGNNLDLTDDFAQLKIKDLYLADHRNSSFENINYIKKTAGDSIHVNIPKLDWIPDINAIINGKVVAGDIRISNPVIYIDVTRKNETETAKKFSHWADTKISRLFIEHPTLEFSKSGDKGTAKMSWKAADNVFELEDFNISTHPQPQFAAEKIHLLLHHFLYSSPKGRILDAGDGELNVLLNKVELQQNETNDWDWKAIISKLETKNFVLDSLGKQSGKLTITSARLSDFSVFSSSLLNLRELITTNTKFRLDELTGSYYTNKNQFNWYNTSYDKNTRFCSADSFSYRPAKDQQAFIAASHYQTDYIMAKTGAITVGPFDIDRYITDSILDIGVMNIHNSLLAVFRDKRQPRKPGTIRLLPANLLKRIPARLLVDTFKLNNGHVEYAELNEKTNKTGMITVASLNGLVTKMRNYDLTNTDSLHIRAAGFIDGKIQTKLNVKEAYTDSLGGFLMTVQMGPGDLTVFNPVLRPLASAELRSGQLDTLVMRVVGREELAFGEIKMFYHDLKVTVLNKGDNKRSFLGGIKNFFANAIIINKNSEKSSTVFFRRLRDRSAINYLVKITLNGIINTVTGKQNRKKFRHNKEEIKKRHLPAIEKIEPHLR